MVSEAVEASGGVLDERYEDDAALRIEHLSVAFPRTGAPLLAAFDVGLQVRKGRTLGLVGESGSGKSVTLRAMLGLVPYPGEVLTGTMHWRGSVLDLTRTNTLRRLRGADVGMVFQDPMSSLNPVVTIGDALVEVLRKKPHRSRAEARSRAVELLTRCRDTGG